MGPNGVSLNDCLKTGPNPIPLLPEILIRFRRWPVAMIADITKAFLQLGINRMDQDVFCGIVMEMSSRSILFDFLLATKVVLSF
jgi:hypothetical protein